MKTCNFCKRDLPVTEYWKRAASGDGLSNKCKECTRAYWQTDKGRALKMIHDRRLRAKRRAERERMFGADRRCQICATELPVTARSNARYCSKRCQDAAYYRRHTEKIRQQAIEWRENNSDRARENARLWKENNREHARKLSRDYQHRRRARIVGRLFEEFDREEVFERDGWVCGICGNPVERADASLDHIIPIARGGEHSRQNCQLAHLNCNKAKGARLPEELAA